MAGSYQLHSCYNGRLPYRCRHKNTGILTSIDIRWTTTCRYRFQYSKMGWHRRETYEKHSGAHKS